MKKLSILLVFGFLLSGYSAAQETSFGMTTSYGDVVAVDSSGTMRRGSISLSEISDMQSEISNLKRNQASERVIDDLRDDVKNLENKIEYLERQVSNLEYRR